MRSNRARAFSAPPAESNFQTVRVAMPAPQLVGGPIRLESRQWRSGGHHPIWAIAEWPATELTILAGADQDGAAGPVSTGHDDGAARWTTALRTGPPSPSEGPPVRRGVLRGPHPSGGMREQRRSRTVGRTRWRCAVAGERYGGTHQGRAIAATLLHSAAASGLLLLAYYWAPLDRPLTWATGWLFLLALLAFVGLMALELLGISRSDQ